MGYKSDYTGAEQEAAFDAVIDGTIAAIAGSKSHLTDTGLVTTDHLRQINASVSSQSTGDRSQINTSSACVTSGVGSQINSSYYSTASGVRTQINASKRIINSVDQSMAGGNSESGDPATANRTWHIYAVLQSGVSAHFAGTVVTSHTFSDFAEMVANGAGMELEPGTLLSLFGDKVYPAREGDDISGVVSATPGTLHGDTPFCWKGRYEADKWGRLKTEKTFDKKSKEETVALVDSPDWNPEIENVPRSARPAEWVKVGMVGIVRVKTNDSVTQAVIDDNAKYRKGTFIKASDVEGIGTLTGAKTNILAMSVVEEYDADCGYAIILCKIG